MTDTTGGLTLLQSYQPYGDVMDSVGDVTSNYGFAGEWTDGTGLQHLRARYLDTGIGRFITKDTWPGDYNNPMSLNRWMYVEGNPVNYTDPSGWITKDEATEANNIYNSLLSIYNVRVQKDWGDWTNLKIIDPDQSVGFPFVTSPYDNPLPQMDIPQTCEWRKGEWDSIQELRNVLTAISLLGARMGYGNYRRAFSEIVDVKRADTSKPWNKSDTGLAPFPIIVNEMLGDVLLSDYVFNQHFFYQVGTIIHEMGHVWDFRTDFRLSMGLQERLGNYSDQEMYEVCIRGLVINGQYRKAFCSSIFYEYHPEIERAPGAREKPYAGTAMTEDWAESFEAAIFPESFIEARYEPIGPIREQYVMERINGLP